MKNDVYKKAYKVVVRDFGYKRSDGVMQSVSVSAKSQHIARYQLEKWTLPTVPHSKLFVFETLADAKGFGGINSIVFECLVKNPRRAKFRVLSFDSLMEVEQFWKDKKNHKRPSVRIEYTPNGTLFVDAVKLTKQIT